jgi:hypothetical protein
MKRAILRCVELVARSLLIATLCLMGLTLIAVTMIRLTAIPVRFIEQEIPTWHTQQHPRTTRSELPPNLRWASLRAQLDHFINPVPELRYDTIRRFGGPAALIRVEPDQMFLELNPCGADCAVIYRCTPDGNLLWKSFDAQGP